MFRVVESLIKQELAVHSFKSWPSSVTEHIRQRARSYFSSPKCRKDPYVIKSEQTPRK